MLKKKHKDKLKRRKDKVKSNKYYRKYIEWHPTVSNHIVAVYCKGCGTQIRGLNQDNILIPYWNYRENTIEFDDRSAPQTPICVKYMNIKDTERLEAAYISDLETFAEEVGGDDDKMWEAHMKRKPKKLARKQNLKKLKRESK